MHVGGADGGLVAYALGGVHVGVVRAVVASVHRPHGGLNAFGCDDTVGLEAVDEVVVGLAVRAPSHRERSREGEPADTERGKESRNERQTNPRSQSHMVETTQPMLTCLH